MRMRLSDSKITRWLSGKRAWLWGEKSELSSLVCYFGFYSLFDVYFSYDILFQCFLLYSTWVVFYSQFFFFNSDLSHPWGSLPFSPSLPHMCNFFSLTATSHTLEEVYRSPPVFLTCAARLQKQVSCTIGSHSTEHGELQNRFSYFPFPLLLLFFFFSSRTQSYSRTIVVINFFTLSVDWMIKAPVTLILEMCVQNLKYILTRS